MIVYIETYKLEPNTTQSEHKAETKPNPTQQSETNAANRTQRSKANPKPKN